MQGNVIHFHNKNKREWVSEIVSLQEKRKPNKPTKRWRWRWTTTTKTTASRDLFQSLLLLLLSLSVVSQCITEEKLTIKIGTNIKIKA